MNRWMVIIDAVKTKMHRFVCSCYVIYEMEHSRIGLVGMVVTDRWKRKRREEKELEREKNGI